MGDTDYSLNLIDTPGHVDFSYEVSRSLAACESAVLLVDATQGIEAQTLANAYAALELDLTIIPVVNKTDLPTARTEEVARELVDFLGADPSEVMRVSAKTGAGVRELLDRIVAETPPPPGNANAPLRALVFDSAYDQHQGVVAYVRVMDGHLQRGDRLQLVQAGTRAEAVDVGVFVPTRRQQNVLGTGEVGFVATGLKDTHDLPAGDTVAPLGVDDIEALPGYRQPKPLVFAGLYCTNPEAYPDLRDALERLRLSDPALTFQPEKSLALGFGFRAGFLGVLHMDIVRERLEREFDIELVITTPQVEYEVEARDGTISLLDSPADFPELAQIAAIREPWMRLSIITPTAYIGRVSELLANRRGSHHRMEHIEPTRVVIEYDLALAEMLTGFFDTLKSVSRGYASMDYNVLGYREADLVRLDIKVNGQIVDALSTLVLPRPRANRRPRSRPAHPSRNPAPTLRSSRPGRHRLPHRRPRNRPPAPQGRSRQVLRPRRLPQEKAPGIPKRRQAPHEARRPRRHPPGSLLRRPPTQRPRRPLVGQTATEICFYQRGPVRSLPR